ncbi:DUF3888 domain-containing protein [uncultured Clostridium sp.]|uniref:DUF3888 domain-containing protein n=1 Tax=uncultured Clostridium sp. TaxID=59620 RepID=UPI0028EAA519|nr:DUF3888 domain-containing protein [uncultured Clostridium sp.]
MKKFIYALCLIFLISNTCVSAKNLNLKSTNDSQNIIKSEPKPHSIEELYQDIIMTLLTPHINKAIKDYYGEEANFDLFSIKVLEATRLNGYRTFSFKLKIQVDPFQGPHNTIGIDNLTFIIDSLNVRLEKFEHIKSF